jgi:predicted nuclease of predicted toxin-antitoxin system
VKLLFDQNISQRLIEKLKDEFPGSAHVKDFRLQSADDEAIWNLAKQEEFTIVSKDSDFHQRSFLFGPPPKVIWIRCGNSSTIEIETILKIHVKDIQSFDNDRKAAFLALS